MTVPPSPAPGKAAAVAGSRVESVSATGAAPSAVAAALVELALAGKAELLSGGFVVRG